MSVFDNIHVLPPVLAEIVFSYSPGELWILQMNESMTIIELSFKEFYNIFNYFHSLIEDNIPHEHARLLLRSYRQYHDKFLTMITKLLCTDASSLFIKLRPYFSELDYSIYKRLGKTIE